jgi:hypothetical protein
LIQKYFLDKSKLLENTESLPYRQAWSVQKTTPENYIGQEISVYAFISEYTYLWRGTHSSGIEIEIVLDKTGE